MTLSEFKRKVFVEAVKKAGRLVSKEQGDARINRCRTRRGGLPCEFMGTVQPLPTLKLMGCRKCGCPFATKPYMKSIAGKRIECPHPQGNQWEEIDLKFENKE